MNAKILARVGGAALRIYVNHMLVFTVGAGLGAFTAFVVLIPYIIGAAQ